MLQWGYSDGIPAGVTTAWGCRAIFRYGNTDVLHDRQSVAGKREDIDAMGVEVKACWKKWQDAAREQYHAGKLGEDDVATLLETDTLVIKARAAGGYLYVVAYPRGEVADVDA